MLRKLTVLAAAFGLALSAAPALAAGHPEPAKKVDWSFSGPFGNYDQAQLQRGYKVYKEVCASCHAMSLLAYRNLGDRDGPFYNPEYAGRHVNDNPVVKAIAAEFEVADIDTSTGEAITRPATAADRFRSPFPNAETARASNGGALPPDLSMIAKARSAGPDYIYSLLTGYHTPPAGLNVPTGQHYNPYMPGDTSSFWTGEAGHSPPGGFLAMPPPLRDGAVTFDDGTPGTVDQQAKDVSAFLMWAAEPKLGERHRAGFSVMIFLLIFAGLLYASYRKVWANESH